MSANSDASRFQLPEYLVIGGVALVLLAGGLPFVEADRAIIDVNGSLESSMQGLDAPDWYIMVGLAVIGGLVGLFGSWGGLSTAVTGLCGLIVAGLAAMYINDPTLGAEYTGLFEPNIDPGIGLFAVLIGGVLLIGGAAMGYTQRSTQSQPRAGGRQEPARQPQGPPHDQQHHAGRRSSDPDPAGERATRGEQPRRREPPRDREPRQRHPTDDTERRRRGRRRSESAENRRGQRDRSRHRDTRTEQPRPGDPPDSDREAQQHRSTRDEDRDSG